MKFTYKVRKCRAFLVKNFMSAKLIKITVNIMDKFKDFEETTPKI